MNCVILQPSYIPWRGYFDQVNRADTFVFYDDVQFDKGGWRHRNKVLLSNGPGWLSIPVRHKGHLKNQLLIKDVEIVWDQNWIEKHWRSLQQSYRKAPFFVPVIEFLRPYYESAPSTLCELVIPLTVGIARYLGCKTQFFRSSELGVFGEQTERLVNICKHFGASHYISGPSAQNYLDESAFIRGGISLEYMSYDFPNYTQLIETSEPLSILDLLFMKGPHSGQFIWGPTSESNDWASPTSKLLLKKSDEPRNS
jgi:hypothetical protein